MILKFSDYKLKLIRLLQDVSNDDSPVGGQTYGADMLKDATHAALDAITSRIWKTSTFAIEAEADSEDLPADAIDVQAVFETYLDLFIPRIQFAIGQALSSTTGNAWHLYPTGSIVFVNPIGSDGAVAYYSARWSKPDKDNDLLEPPESTLTCLLLYSASYCLVSDSIGSANIRQFNTRVDSGTPTDIPAKVISDFLMKRFNEELQRIPIMDKARNI